MSVGAPGSAPRLRRRGWAPALGGTLLLALAAIAPGANTPASAAAGDPFDPADPTVFISQGNPTQLSLAVTDPSGGVDFQPEGSPTPGLVYNGIGYNTADNFLYGFVVSSDTYPSGALIRIGQGGVTTRIGSETVSGGARNSATFGPDGYLYAAGSSALSVIDVSDGTTVKSVPLSGDAVAANDIAYAEGYFWAAGRGLVSRTDPATGETVSWELEGIPESDAAGGAWTFGNGNLGFLFNTTGTLIQLKVGSPAEAHPDLSIASSTQGPASNQNDGASSPGLPTDLVLTKTGPVALIAGEKVRYSLTVTNRGDGNSSGYVLSDAVPFPLTDITATDPGCSVEGSDVTCLGGRLIAGESVTYTIEAEVPSGTSAEVTNTAQVTANEADPVADNNSASTTARPGTLELTKRAETPSDVNGNGITDAGDTIRYTFVLRNTGQVALDRASVSDPKVGKVSCPAESFAPGDTIVCTADQPYSITVGEASAGSAENTATAQANPVGSDQIVSSAASQTSTPVSVAAPALTLVKHGETASDAPSSGDPVHYTFTVKNTGNVGLVDVDIEEAAFTGTGPSPSVDCPTDELAPAAEMICTADYEMTQADVDSGRIENTAKATALSIGAPGASVDSEDSKSTVLLAAAPALELVKTANAEGTSEFTAGSSLQYSFVITNTGNVSLSDVGIDELEFSGSGPLTAPACPDHPAPLAPGDQLVCSATYVLSQEDIDAGSVKNTAKAFGSAPGASEPTSSSPSEAQVPALAQPSLHIEKTADTDRINAIGQVITYRFAIENTGNTTLSNVTVVEESFTGQGARPQPECATNGGVLLPGERLECTAEYTVVAADLTGRPLSNTATARAISPTSEITNAAESTAVIEEVARPGAGTGASADSSASGDAARPSPGLPTTGGPESMISTALVAVLVLSGAAVLLVRLRRTREPRP